MKRRILAVANQKGGVGKTTTAINLASAIAVFERPATVVDLDPQANATSGLGIELSDEASSTYQVLLGEATLDEILVDSSFPGLRVAPGEADLAGAEVELVGMVGREFRLREAFAASSIEGYVFIDCPPSLSLLTLNAMAAADGVIVPIQCEYFALEGVAELMRTIEQVRRYVNPGLVIEAVLLTMYDERTKLAQQVADEVRKHFSTTVLETLVPRNVRLAEAPSFGQTVHAYDMRCRGSKAYLGAGRELITRIEFGPEPTASESAASEVIHGA